ncbi:MAG: hypothetical protein LAT55_02150 [Opitutales bacterium]|nr:hypothetical protein [Opitutales bacterium]
MSGQGKFFADDRAYMALFLGGPHCGGRKVFLQGENPPVGIWHKEFGGAYIRCKHNPIDRTVGYRWAFEGSAKYKENFPSL